MRRLVVPGCEIEREVGGRHVERHHHLGAYAALVLRGGYVEAGDRGRIAAEAGDALFHDAFEAHMDQFDRSGAEILNLPLASVPAFAKGRIADPDAIAVLSRGDTAAATAALLDQAEELATAPADWPDLLAAALSSAAPFRLDAWAHEHGLAPSSVSRGFRLAYGVSPKRYRLELHAGAAARAARRGCPLSEAAFAAGFSDQPHMTRAVHELFGATPQRLRH